MIWYTTVQLYTLFFNVYLTIPKSPNPPQSHNPGNDWVLGAKSGSDSSDLIAFNQVGGLIANAIYIYIFITDSTVYM